MIQIITLTRAHSSVTEMFFTKSAVLFRKLLGWNTRSAIKQSFWISWIMLLCFFFFFFFPPLSREMVTLTTSKCRVFDEGFFFFAQHGCTEKQHCELSGVVQIPNSATSSSSPPFFFPFYNAFAFPPCTHAVVMLFLSCLDKALRVVSLCVCVCVYTWVIGSRIYLWMFRCYGMGFLHITIKLSKTEII